MIARLCGLLSVSSLLSCFSPDLSNVTYRCDEQRPGCPTGHSCISGYCRPLSDGATADGASGGDAAAGDLRPLESGCADGKGTALGSRAFACPGIFAAGQAASRCAVSWSLCKDGAAVDLSACNTKLTTGFFLAEVAGRRGLEMPADAICGAINPPPEPNRMFFGCGPGGVGYAFDAKLACGNFSRVLDCERAEQPNPAQAKWLCGMSFDPHTLASVTNKTALDGVLCCK